MTKRRRIGGLVAAAAAMVATIIAGTPAMAVSFHQVPNYGTRKCIDVAAENNFWVQQWHCINNDNQQMWLPTLVDPTNNRWTFTSKVTGQCLAIYGNSLSAGTQSTMDWCGSPSALWHITYANNTGSGWHQQLQNVNSGLCLDLLNNNSADGTIIQQWYCTDELSTFNAAQLWMMG